MTNARALRDLVSFSRGERRERGRKKERKKERREKRGKDRGTHAHTSLERTGGRNTVRGYHGEREREREREREKERERELVATLCTGGGERRGGHASLVRFVKPAKEKTHASRRLDVD